jgi:hypothetical protein
LLKYASLFVGEKAWYFAHSSVCCDCIWLL